ncbi:MAG: MMPL family transporter [Nocardioides sp.]|uniref:MMPL family transporter n=1 Tax=Nocardioides sp. TaxID=35761 RepID=UPI0039E2516E
MSNPLTAIPMRAARWSALHPWRAILAWIALVLVAVGLAATVSVHETDDADFRVGDSGRASALLHQAGMTPLPSENILIRAAHGQLDVPQARAVAADLASRARDAEGVASVSTPILNAARTAVLVSVDLRSEDSDVTDLQRLTASVQQAHRDLSVRQSGDVSLDEAIDDRVGEDLGSAERLSLPVTLLLMLLAFGALIAAGIPVLLAGTSVAATIGLMAPLSHLVHSDSTVSSMIVLIGMAVGVDYSLFYLKREREERRAGRSTLDAVEIAAQTSGHSVVVSGGAVIAAMAGLFLMADATFDSLAVGAILVVAVAVLGSITVLPALLVKLGRWVDRPRLPLLWRIVRRNERRRADRRARGQVRPGLTERLLRPVVRRPQAALLLGVVVVGTLAVPAFGMRTHASNLDTLPSSIPEVSTAHQIERLFPSDGGSTARVVVRGTGDTAGYLKQVGAAAVATGVFTAATQPIDVSADGHTAALTLGISHPEADPRSEAAIRELRAEVIPSMAERADAAHVSTVVVGGGVAEEIDYADHQSGRLLLVIGFVLALTMLIMVTTFRSVVLAVVSTLLNLGSVGAAFGVMTLVFQHGFLAGPLGFTSPGFVIDWLPLFVLVVLVGLSMDYHVFVITRIREYVDAGIPTRIAVAKGVGRTAGVVTSAAAVMVSVFAIFATMSILEMKMMGVALATAILIDATVVRLVMLPAVLVWLGERAWWPRRPVAPAGVAVTDPASAQVTGQVTGQASPARDPGDWAGEPAAR